MIKYEDPCDSAELRAHRNNFENKVQSWCLANDIDFFGTYDNIKSSRYDKIVKLTVFELIHSESELAALDLVLGKNGQHLFYLTDNFLDHEKVRQFGHITLISIPELLGMISLAKVHANTAPSRLYNCFIQRVDSVRQSWFYLLQHHGLLDKGYVTFLLYQYSWYCEKTGLDLYDWIHTQHSLCDLPHFEKAYHALRPQVPYRNFAETTDLHKYASDCKYSMVLETYAVEDNSVGFCFTEKTHRALQTPTINLFFSQQNSLPHLVRLGFQIVDFMLEIDQHPWQVRQQKMLDILVDDDVDFDVDSLYNQAMHNRDLIAIQKQKFLHGGFFEKMLSDIVQK